MSKYTKAQLEALTKGPLVDVALSLVAQLEAASGEPLTSATIEKRLLDLNTQAITVKSNAEKAQAAHVEKLAQIEADYQKSVKSLELQYESTLGADALELNAVYDSIKEKAGEAITDLSYGLKEAEIEAKGKLEIIQAKQVEATEKFEATVKEYQEQVAKAIETKNSAINKLEVEHTRKVEQLNYDNSIAIRDENEKVAVKIAKDLGKELIDSNELADLKGEKSLTEEEISSAIKIAVDSATTKVYASEGAKYSKLQSESINTISLLQNDKAHLESTVEAQKLRINDLDERLKDVPAQIAAAVGAAKANVSVAQTTGK